MESYLSLGCLSRWVSLVVWRRFATGLDAVSDTVSVFVFVAFPWFYRGLRVVLELFCKVVLTLVDVDAKVVDETDTVSGQNVNLGKLKMICKTVVSTALVDDLVAAGLLTVTILDDSTETAADRVRLYQRLLDALVDQARHEGLNVTRDGEPLTSDNLCVDELDDCFEECDACRYREISDGYGGNDCPCCGERMRVCHR
jgi:hypothetical protein